MKKFIAFLLLSLLFSGCHVGRFFKWNFADTRDQYKFKSAEVAAAATPFQFIAPTADTSQLRYPRSLTLNGTRWNFEELLEADKTAAFLIIHKDTLVYEKYFGKYSQSTPHTSFSVAKSFVSALVGIAIAEGKIEGVDEPITNYINFKHPGFEKVTIQHLLDMRSGIAYNESYVNPFSDVAKHYYGLNLDKFIYKLKMEYEPGTRFRYSSINTQLLAAIVEKATGRKIYDYLEEKIWQPLGMEYDATWNVDGKKTMTAKAFCCINARARDFAKFGRLYLNKGNWNGQQVVPESWVEASTTFDSTYTRFYYKNQWWHSAESEILTDSTSLIEPYHIYERTAESGETTKYVTRPGEAYWAQGILGQYIYVHPENEVIVVRLGHKNGKHTGGGWAQIAKFIADMYNENEKLP